MTTPQTRHKSPKIISEKLPKLTVTEIFQLEKLDEAN